MKRYLITGGGGFIGSHLVNALTTRGDFVRVLDNFSGGRRVNLKNVDAEIIEGDIRDSRLLSQAMHNIDIVFHTAALVSVPESLQNPTLYFDVNITGTEHVLEAARQHDIQRVILSSSAAVYGNQQQLPLKENYPALPLSPYALSKNINETYAISYNKIFGVGVVILRYFNVYGPRQLADKTHAAVIPLFLQALLATQAPTISGNGEQTRDFIFVDDVIAANLIAAEHPAAEGQIFNICTGQETTLLSLAEESFKFFPNAPQPLFTNPRNGDISRSIGCPKKAFDLLGFKAQVPLSEGLEKTIQYHQIIKGHKK